jgi:hypothetical protein
VLGRDVAGMVVVDEKSIDERKGKADYQQTLR